jgi:hypothetical protein
MSYFNMDHAAWVESSCKRTLTPFQARVFDIAGCAFGGIYNAGITWKSVCWDYGDGISFVRRGDIATTDFNQLTLLVVLCHIAKIRMEISSANPGRLRYSFWQRAATDRICTNHPSIYDAATKITAALPTNSRIWYKHETTNQG